jgi:hypothetical protein
VLGSEEYLEWKHGSLALEARRPWRWSWEVGKQPTEHWRHREVGRWWYISEAAYEKMPHNEQLIADDIGRIMESDLGQKLEGDNACSECQVEGYECWVYSPEVFKEGELRYSGFACARCRASLNSDQCDALQNKTPQARINMEIAAEVRHRLGVENVPATAALTPTTRSDSAANGHVSRGTKRKADDLTRSDEDTLLENLSRQMQEGRIKLRQIKESIRQFDFLQDQHKAEVERFHDESEEEEEDLFEEYPKKCKETEDRTYWKSQEHERENLRKREEMLQQKEKIESTVEIAREKIKLARFGTPDWDRSER